MVHTVARMRMRATDRVLRERMLAWKLLCRPPTATDKVLIAGDGAVTVRPRGAMLLRHCQFFSYAPCVYRWVKIPVAGQADAWIIDLLWIACPTEPFFERLFALTRRYQIGRLRVHAHQLFLVRVYQR